MSFLNDNAAYESWLRQQCAVVADDLDEKHKRMDDDAFMFLRATCFRWSKKVTSWCPELRSAPAVLSVGDAHIENFGTWRDAEGRLVWGINDFDDAADTPYPLDLVRLAASAHLAPKVRIGDADMADAILRGYRTGLETPRPTLLDEQALDLRPILNESESGRGKFWKKLRKLPTADPDPPPAVQKGFAASLPDGAEIERFTTRTAGGGSRGRPRFTVIAIWNGGRIVREAKAFVPSSWNWAHGIKGPDGLLMKAARGAFRSPDPHLDVKAGFIFRRLSPSARKIELKDLPDPVGEVLLEAMGFDIGAIHAADASSREAIIADLEGRPSDWLARAASIAAAAVEQDYKAWTDRRR